MNKPNLVMWVVTLAGITVLLCFLALGFLFTESQNQRKESCKAILIALEATSETAAAGIRPISTDEPTGISPSLARAFARQREATIRENDRRRNVIARTNKAAADLRRSGFCRG